MMLKERLPRSQVSGPDLFPAPRVGSSIFSFVMDCSLKVAMQQLWKKDPPMVLWQLQ